MSFATFAAKETERLNKRCSALLDVINSVKPNFIKVTEITYRNYTAQYAYHSKCTENSSEIINCSNIVRDKYSLFPNESGKIDYITIQEDVDVLDLTEFNCAEKVEIYLDECYVDTIINNPNTSLKIFRCYIDDVTIDKYINMLNKLEVYRTDIRNLEHGQFRISRPNINQYEIVDLEYVEQFHEGEVTDEHFNDCKDNLKKLFWKGETFEDTCSASTLKLNPRDLGKLKQSKDKLEEQLPNLNEIKLCGFSRSEDDLKLSEIPEVKSYTLSLFKGKLIIDSPLECLNLTYLDLEQIENMKTKEVIELLNDINFDYFPTKKLVIGRIVFQLTDTSAKAKSARN